MGSLILLLLVIDRRAKVVMRAKAMETIRRMEMEDEKETADRAAEWERRRRSLHDHLQKQKEDLEAQAASLDQQITAISRDLKAEEDHGFELDHRIQDQLSLLERHDLAVASRLQETVLKKEQSESTQAELARMTNDLVKLEQTLADLRDFRKKQQQTYSLVPYRGRRGDNRRPIYLECAAGEMILHPDRLVVPVTDAADSAILTEVEKRIGRLESIQANTSKKETPYLLLLVRPDGVVTYYRTLTALKNLTVDFGYEFVQADWILSFPEDEKDGGVQPWMASGPVKDNVNSGMRHDTQPNRQTVAGSPIPSGSGESPEQWGSGIGNRTSRMTGSFGSPGAVAPTIANLGNGLGTSGIGGGKSEANSFSSAEVGTAGPKGMSTGLSGKSEPSGSGRLASFPGPGNGKTGLGSGNPSTNDDPGIVASQGNRGLTLGAVRPRGVSFAGQSGFNDPTINENSGETSLDSSQPGGDGINTDSKRDRVSSGASNNPGSLSGNSLDSGKPATGISALGSGNSPSGVIGPSSGATSSNGNPAQVAPFQTPKFSSLAPGGTGRQGFRQDGLDISSGPGLQSGSGIAGGSQVGPSGQSTNDATLANHSGNPPGRGSASAQSNSAVVGTQFPASSGFLQANGSASPSLIPNVGGNPNPNPSSPGQGSGSNSSNSSSPANGVESRAGSASPQSQPDGSYAEASSPLSRFGGQGATTRGSQDKRPQPPPVIRRYVRPEWNIFIECTAKEVVVYPGGSHIPASALGGSGASNNRQLLQSIQQMIERRKAVIASTDSQGPNQAPQIRFLVRPDGLRTYFLAFPELTPLQLSMTRENLDADENMIRHITGR
jgi:hypothetical protein